MQHEEMARPQRSVEVSGITIPGALDAVRNEIDRTENNLERLIDRLGPILADSRPTESIKSGGSSVGDSELAQQIYGAAGRLESLASRISYIVDRVDL